MSKMFRDHWIVADMDGTLTPTPTRAHGKYLSLSYCMLNGLGYGARYRSCLPWLRFFIERGGSVCVVSTAGRRMWKQLYPDLAPAVFRLGLASGSLPLSGCTEKRLPPGPPSLPQATASSSSAAAPGRLYICGYTGAALYRTRPCAVVWADMDRLQPDWRLVSPAAVEAAEARAADPDEGPTVEGDGTAPGVFAIPPPAIGLEQCTAYGHEAAQEDAEIAGLSTTMNQERSQLVQVEGRKALIRLFEHASYISGHNAARAAPFFEQCLSTKYHKVFTALLQDLLHEVKRYPVAGKDGSVAHVCFADSELLSQEALNKRGLFLKETNDALVDTQRLPRADGTILPGAPAAQVVIMGIPMRYFHDVFPSTDAASSGSRGSEKWHCCPACAADGAGAKARMEAAGLELKSQPNSVCVHQHGVDKATCVRWLLARHSAADPAFELTKAIAMGDVPESVDKPLTEFPPMQFISLSPKDKAAERLAQQASTAIEADAKTMRPRCKGNPCIYHVGGEEEGTAFFLEELLTSCATEEWEQRKKAATADNNPAAAAQPQTWFSPERVAACAAKARALMEAELERRRKPKLVSLPVDSAMYAHA